MSSTPMTPGSVDAISSPASSPPSSPPETDDAYDPKVERMRAEEERLRKESRREDKARKEADKERLDKNGGDASYMKDLDWFLNRSQGFSSTVMDQLKQALEARKVERSAQPKLVTGGKMRDYQLEGLTWLTCLYQIGLNGILADEMGLGKTIQLISFLAFLRENGTNGPFLILGPLSTVNNWVREFAFWTPGIPVVMYHGSPQVRGQIRRQQLKGDARGPKFPVVCTSYEICMRDKKFLAAYPWKFIVVDEGHRLKNFNCKLVRELKQYPSESRLILTGTPLQNNLTELWSLLNFLLPEAFSDLEHFESMFDFSDVQDKDGHKQFMSKERQQRTVASLHAILKPFLLRRVKNDVETNLPKKREYILYAPLTPVQKEMYRKIKDNDIRSYLEEKAIERIGEKLEDSRVSEMKGKKRKAGSGTSTPNKSAKSSRGSTPASSIRSGRAKRQNYSELSDTEYFRQLENSSGSEEVDDEEREEQERAETLAQARKEVNQKKLQNPVMQLRLACNSPHHFSWPWAPDADPDETLVTESGKMVMLDRLVPYLFSKGHKIIIFSQFSKQLDILEDWASILRGWPVCRIDGAVKAEDRQEQIEAFNSQKNHGLFLLSTRAGGLGINLTSADTVILFDSDWNPQQDLQAQDRAHRIGQTRPVIIYRLATKGTIEQTLLEKADGKRRLEKLVIQKDKFRSILDRKPKSKSDDDYAELQQILANEDFENYDPGEGADVLSDADLKLLTDRSAKAYERAEKGEGSGDKFKTIETKADGQDILGSLAK
ncbi:ATP-dependent DNA helicase, partial [Lecanoromycetidae sp. Uapishka_2]